MSKIRRNSLCPCGSGKKYKRCCIDKNVDPATEKNSPHYFRLKGKNAEEVMHELAQKTFFTDWCFLNPKLDNGKELCDLLVVFDNIAIVWQIKNLKLDEDGQYKPSDKAKNISQLYGAKRSLFDLKKPIELQNARRINEVFDPTFITETYYISVLVGEGEWSYSPTEDYKGMYINVFSGKTLSIILSELDTIADFTNYLREKKNFHETTDTGVIIDGGGEEDLMAYWLMNGRSFAEYTKANMLLLDGGAWDYFTKRGDFVKKKEADRISYGWDSIIDRAHEGSTSYEKVARELARPDRFKRRILAQAFFDAHLEAHKIKDDNVAYRRACPEDEVTYCFFFMGAKEDRKSRIDGLTAFCMVARLEFNTRKVVGIATESKIEKTCAYDFCVLDIPTITDEFRQNVLTMQTELGILINPAKTRVDATEYPE